MCRRRKGASRPAGKAQQAKGGKDKGRGSTKARKEPSNEPSNEQLPAAISGPACFPAPVQTTANHKLVCPMSLDVMIDPVCTVDGQTYERRYIERWLQHHDTSPLTNLTLSSKKLVPNDAIKSVLEDCKHQSHSAEGAVAEEEQDTEDEFECELECGFAGSFSEVEVHERTCTADAAASAGSAEPRFALTRVFKHTATAQMLGARAAPGCAAACSIM